MNNSGGFSSRYLDVLRDSKDSPVKGLNFSSIKFQSRQSPPQKTTTNRYIQLIGNTPEITQSAPVPKTVSPAQVESRMVLIPGLDIIMQEKKKVVAEIMSINKRLRNL